MKLRYRIGTRVINFIWRIFFGYKVYGRENIPKNGAFILASNHLSNFDPPLLGTSVWFRECYFFAKKELFTPNKFFSWFIRAYNAYVADREKPFEGLKKSIELLNRGIPIIFFPEGTRSKAGKFLSFHEGVVWLALKSKVPIIPAAIKNTNTPLIKQFIRKSKVKIKIGCPIYYDGYENTKSVRNKLVNELRDKIESLYNSL